LSSYSWRTICCSFLLLFLLFLTSPTVIYTFPYTTLFRSVILRGFPRPGLRPVSAGCLPALVRREWGGGSLLPNLCIEVPVVVVRSEEHTSELQSRENLVCRLLLEKKKNTTKVENDAKIR